MEHLAALYPANVSISELGHSAEGREMYTMRISGGASVDRDGRAILKKGFVIFGAQHAREESTSVHLTSTFPCLRQHGKLIFLLYSYSGSRQRQLSTSRTPCLPILPNLLLFPIF